MAVEVDEDGCCALDCKLYCERLPQSCAAVATERTFLLETIMFGDVVMIRVKCDATALYHLIGTIWDK